MKYVGNKGYQHGSNSKIGILITNLGTPDAPTKVALKRYLKEFLSDPRVVEVPKLIWWLVLNLIILNIRPKRSAHAYSTVWTDRGSPLLFHTQDQCAAIASKLSEKWGDKVEVDYAMRYGTASITEAIDRLTSKGAEKLLVMPLYPQYSASTSGSTFDAIAHDFLARRRIPDFRFISSYQDYDPYIEACADKIRAHWQSNGKPQKLILSYHGIPLRYLHSGDPYHCHCYKTSRLIAEKLELDESEYMTTFQSRFGREEWLQPYTDHTLMALPKEGIKSIHVFCPGFSADCLETIEEIGEENKEYFMEAGGESYEYIPALNAEPNHIDALTSLIELNLQGWDVEFDAEISRKEFEKVKSSVPQHQKAP